jgi:hypothetical protein
MKRPFLSSIPWLPLVLLLLRTGASAGTVQTRDGQSLEGDLSLERDAVVVTRPSGQRSSVRWQEVALATFAAPPKTLTLADPAWQSRDVGEVIHPGSTRLAADRAWIEASGWGLWPSEDAFRLVSVPMPGDGQLLARTTAWHNSNGTMRGGITLRAGFSSTAPHASLLTSATGTVYWIARSGSQHAYREINTGPPKTWMRLTRAGDRVTASLSADGQRWDPVDSVTMAGTNGWLAGLVGCAQINAFLGAVELDHVQAVVGLPQSPSADLPSPSVVLRDGSILAGAITVFDDHIGLSRKAGAVIKLPWASIAAVLFKPIPAPLAAQSNGAARTGVVLSNGDWLEGEIKGASDDEITLTSVLLGIRRVKWDDRLAAVVMAGITRKSTDWEIQLRDGSQLRVPGLQADADRIRSVHPAAGALEIPAADLMEIKSRPARSP